MDLLLYKNGFAIISKLSGPSLLCWNVPLTEHMDIVLMKEASRAEGSDAKNGYFSTYPIYFSIISTFRLGI